MGLAWQLRSLLLTKGIPALFRCPERLRQALVPAPHASEAGYQIWLLANSPSPRRLRRMRRESASLPSRPLLSVVTPVLDPPLPFLREAIASVRRQAYPYWELCLVDDGSSDPAVHELLRSAAREDARVKVKLLPERTGIATATNHGLAMASGDFVAFLDHDDLITPEALYEIARCLNEHPDADMIYSDEDKVDERGVRSGPFFKPAWCPDSFLSRMYTSHLLVLRRSLVATLGGCRKEFEGGQTWDLVLRLTEKTDRIHHVPRVLYQWRVHPGSTAMDADQKPYAYAAYKRAVASALERRGEPGRVVEVPQIKGFYAVRYQILRPGRVSVVVTSSARGPRLDRCLESVFYRTSYTDYEVLVPQDLMAEPETADVILKWRRAEPDRLGLLSPKMPISASPSRHWAEAVSGRYVLLLSSETTVLTDDWLTAMVEQAQRPSVGAVGALLLDRQGRIEHAGAILGRPGAVARSHRGSPVDALGYAGQLVAVNNYLAVSGACLMCRRDLFAQLGPSGDGPPDDAWDVDFCLRLFERGYWNVHLPHVRLCHHGPEARTLITDDPSAPAASAQIASRWRRYQEHDPCYSPHLTRRHEDYRMRVLLDGRELEP